MQRAIPVMLMRGSSSKGLYFAASALPVDRATRDAVLLAAMGSTDARQIDGVGGAHPLTSKVAVISPASRVDIAAISSPVSGPGPLSTGWCRRATVLPLCASIW